MTRALPLLLLLGCSSFVEEGREVPGTGVRYVGPHDARDVAHAVTAWSISLALWTGDTAQVAGTVIDERTLSEELDGYVDRHGRVLVASKERLSDSALMHELTHVHLQRMDGDPDRDHAAGDGPWTRLHDRAIEDARDVLRRCGL